MTGDVDMDTNHQTDLGQDQLEGSDVDVVDASSSKLPIELLGSQRFQIMNQKLPKFQNIVSGEFWSSFYYN